MKLPLNRLPWNAGTPPDCYSGRTTISLADHPAMPQAALLAVEALGRHYVIFSDIRWTQSCKVWLDDGTSKVIQRYQRYRIGDKKVILVIGVFKDKE